MLVVGELGKEKVHIEVLVVEGTGQREGGHRGVGGGGNWAKRRCTSRCWWWTELRKEKVHTDVLVVVGTWEREGAHRGVGGGWNCANRR